MPLPKLPDFKNPVKDKKKVTDKSKLAPRQGIPNLPKLPTSKLPKLPNNIPPIDNVGKVKPLNPFDLNFIPKPDTDKIRGVSEREAHGPDWGKDLQDIIDQLNPV